MYRIVFVSSPSGSIVQGLRLNIDNLYYFCPDLLFQLCLQIVLVLAGDFMALLRNSAFVNIMFNVLVVAGMIRMRLTQPDLKRPFKVIRTASTPTCFICFKFGNRSAILVIGLMYYYTTIYLLAMGIIKIRNIPRIFLILMRSMRVLM